MANAGRILVIEDEKDSIYNARVRWRLQGIDVQVAESVSAAINFVGTNEFNLILVDIRLPKTPEADEISNFAGVEFILDLCSGAYGERNSHTPLMIITNQQHSVDEKRLGTLSTFKGVFDKLNEERIIEFVERFVLGAGNPRESTADPLS